MQYGHDYSNKQEHPALNEKVKSLTILKASSYLLHGSEAKPDMSEEGEGELHARVEEEVEEVGQTNLLQVSVLLPLQVGQTGKLEQL